jgi:hypothetical protein
MRAAILSLDKLDIYVALIAALFAASVLLLLKFVKSPDLPSVQSLQNLATVFNTRGGIVVLLTFMWYSTLAITVGFCIWVVARGIDPQNAVVVTLLGVLVGQAFGNVNGALFKTMTGDEPKVLPSADQSSKTQETSSATTETKTVTG